MADPCRTRLRSFVFRWGSTGSYHGQGPMHDPHDMEWYEPVSDVVSINAMSTIVPELDS
ncbi:hypothetical protein CA54_60760 [Symmachiella macrocystis]|uniref:Uncharacterized protein n=1 Tax=Symmachiella macrocystis TaxID=2527985 RepID=A0A5C6B1A1_9PLAN|nr:hypothetical protein CA54_60760 [Symmachiella macrocystis]